jgi:hypothetical protein
MKTGAVSCIGGPKAAPDSISEVRPRTAFRHEVKTEEQKMDAGRQAAGARPHEGWGSGKEGEG